jgi:hypothetical protein
LCPREPSCAIQKEVCIEAVGVDCPDETNAGTLDSNYIVGIDRLSPGGGEPLEIDAMTDVSGTSACGGLLPYERSGIEDGEVGMGLQVPVALEDVVP